MCPRRLTLYHTLHIFETAQAHHIIIFEYFLPPFCRTTRRNLETYFGENFQERGVMSFFLSFFLPFVRSFMPKMWIWLIVKSKSPPTVERANEQIFNNTFKIRFWHFAIGDKSLFAKKNLGKNLRHKHPILAWYVATSNDESAVNCDVRHVRPQMN